MRFLNPFQRKPVPLAGTPAVRRMKTYSAQSGYVYQYYFEGYRPVPGAQSGTEFVFQISADRKDWRGISVHVSDGALTAWEAAQSRQLSATERYAIAKMALFQAFDEREPVKMKDPVHVREADLAAILESLDL
jgi:hypothetical protein